MLFLWNQKVRNNFLKKACVESFAVLAVLVLFARIGLAQEPVGSYAGPTASLAVLVREAEENNPQIQAARQGWKAAQQVPT